MENITVVNELNKRISRRLSRLRGYPLARFITFNLAFLLSAVLLLVTYHGELILGTILPSLIGIGDVIYFLLYMGWSLSLISKPTGESRVKYVFHERYIEVVTEGDKIAIDFQRIQKVYRKGDIFIAMLSGMSPLTIAASGFVNSSPESFEDMLVVKSIRLIRD